MLSYVDRSHQSDARATIESKFRNLGLVQCAGGTKYTYLAAPGTGKLGMFVRLSKRTMRVVSRRNGACGIFDAPVSPERYFGAVTDERIANWAQVITKANS
jgi:hypothetical protein